MSDRYEIRGKLGRGGMSSIYRGFDTMMGREVAIKRLLAFEETNLNEAAGAEVLAREAGALAKFSHPNVVSVYAFEADDDGAFVVMELVDGHDLHQILKAGALSYEDFKDVAVQSVEPLIDAAELGLLHRDIKPGNIMLTMTPSERFLVKILDFGLAKFSQQPSTQTLDQSGSFLGSIDYIAPEQLELKPLDQRTDLYSLGCVLFFSLAQQSPFTGANPAETSTNHLEHRCKRIHEMRPDVPVPVADWLMRMIARQPDDRPDNARMAFDELQRALKGESPVATAPEDAEVIPSGPVIPAPVTNPIGPTTEAPTTSDVAPPGAEPAPTVSKAKKLLVPATGPVTRTVSTESKAAATLPPRRERPSADESDKAESAESKLKARREKPARKSILQYPLAIGGVMLVIIGILLGLLLMR